MLYIEDRFPKYFLYGLATYCMMLLLLFTSLSVTGDNITSSYSWRLVFTAVIAVPVVLALSINLVFGLCLLTASIGLIKVLLNNGFVSNSTLHFYAFLVVCRSLVCKKKVFTSYTYSEEALAALMLLSALQIIFADSLPRALKLYIGMLELFSFIYVVAPRLTKVQAKYLFECYLFGMTILAVLLLSTYDWSLMPRLGGNVGLNPNNVAMFMSSAIVVCCFGWSTQRKHKLFLLSLFAGCLFLSGSRSVAVGLTLAMLLANIRHWKVLLGLALVGTVAIGILLELKNRNVILAGHFMKGVNEDGSIEYSDMSNKRWLLWTGGLEIASKHALAGIGYSNFSNAVKVDKPDELNATPQKGYLVSHNVYISTAVETGIFGLLLLLLWNFSVVCNFYRKRATLGLVLTYLFMSIGFLQGNYFDIEYALPWALAFAVDDLEIGRKWKAYLVWPGRSVIRPVLLT